MNRRWGYTMIELLIVLGVGSTLLTLAVGMVHRTMRIHANSKHAGVEQHNALRLADALRRDLRRAVATDIEGNALSMVLETPAGKAATEYAWSAGEVVRQQMRPDGSRARESFYFGDGAEFEVRRESNPSRIVALVRKARATSDQPPRTLLNVEVVPGRFTTERLQTVASEE